MNKRPSEPGSDAPSKSRSEPRSAPAAAPASAPPAEISLAKAMRARSALLIGMTALVVLVFGFGLWSVTTTISGAVIASGQIEVAQNRQAVQHPDGGVVAEIHVAEGDNVRQGDVLMRLDGTGLLAELAVVEGQLSEVAARRVRLEAERDGLEQIEIPEELQALAAASPQAAEQFEGQIGLFEARLETLSRTLEQLDRRKAQISAQIVGTDAQMVALQKQQELILRELSDQSDLFERGLTQATRVLSLQREEARLAGMAGELTSTRAQAEERLIETDLQRLGLLAQRREEANNQLREIGMTELQLVQRHRALSEQVARLEIRAPVSGTILGLQVTSPQAVLRAADTVAQIVPQDRPLVIAAQIPTVHIADVAVGQQVRLMFPSFPMNTTPELNGQVILVSADALTDPNTNFPYYRAEITLSAEEVARLGETLLPGMPVEAFLQTRPRTPLTYLLQPFTDYFTQAFRET